MATFPIAAGTLHVAAPFRPVSFTVTNTSATTPASVRVTGPDGSVVWECQLGPNPPAPAPPNKATYSQAIASTAELLPAGDYTIAVTGNVVGAMVR